MTKTKYQRCKKCKELVMDASDCANCKAKEDPLRSDMGWPNEGRQGGRTLDQQEGNWEEWN